MSEDKQIHLTNEDIDEMFREKVTSPTGALDGQVHRLLWDIAPEKAGELISLGKELNTTFDIKIEERINPFRFAASVNTLKTHIKADRGTLDTYWATVFAYSTYMNAYPINEERPIRLKFIEMTAHQEAATILAWADDQNRKIRDGRLTKKYHRTAPWPDGFPFPGKVPIVDQMYLDALGFTLHHEAVHIRKDHRNLESLPPAEIVAKEDECDELAARWMLDGLHDVLSDEYVKRANGIALGLHLLVHLRALSKGVVIPEWHRPIYDRFRRVLSRHLIDNNHPTWRFAFALQQILLSHFNVPCDRDRAFASFRGAFEYCLESASAYSPG